MRVRRPSLAKSWKIHVCARSELGKAEKRYWKTGCRANLPGQQNFLGLVLYVLRKVFQEAR